jgi:hypothetical protein
VGPQGALIVEVGPRLEGAYQNATGESIEGRSLTVRTSSDAGEATAPGVLRIFSGQAEVDSLEPDDPQPGAVLLVRGNGFDPEVLANDELSIVELDPISQAPVCTPPSSPVAGMTACAVAPILVADSTQLVALLPDTMPAEFRLAYRNLAYASLEAALADAAKSGQGDTYVFADPAACMNCKSSPDGSASIPTSTTDTAATTKVSWADPGTIWIELAGVEIAVPNVVRGQAFVLAASGRISYPVSGTSLHQGLQVLLDGVALTGLSSVKGTDGKIDPDRLSLSLPMDIKVGTHVLQVVNPLHRSGLAKLVAQ